jgi:photosynthetic reaction center cytochrome c subunit
MSSPVMRRIATIAVLAVAAATLAGCERPAKQQAQTGYRGTGMIDYQNPRIVAAKKAANVVPAAQPPAPAVGPPASQVYQNVQVLGGLSVPQFTRLMLAITAWVAPEQGCNYCHEGNNLASDALYTKVVSRRMIQMTQHINADWQAHVAQTGVTCWTCHRGKPVPAEIWFNHADPPRASLAGNNARQNKADDNSIGMTSLPQDIYETFLLRDTNIAITGRDALPHGNRSSIKQAEWTFGLMVHMSEGLGVNCTYCHNSRAFNRWEESRPQRLTAWHGIRMARDLNNAYLVPLKPVYPANRLGPSGDAPKLNCATCHQGVYKPLYGTSMLADYAELAAPVPAPPPPAPAPTEPPAEAPAAAPASAQVATEAPPAG